MKGLKSDISDETKQEKVFVVRSYGKSELAMLYLPNMEPKSAVKNFNVWLRMHPGLWDALIATGMRIRAKRYTPAQVQLIADALGNP